MWFDVKSGHQIHDDEGDGTVCVHIVVVMQVMSGMRVVVTDNAMDA
jgi:hypothetical protein